MFDENFKTIYDSELAPLQVRNVIRYFYNNPFLVRLKQQKVNFWVAGGCVRDYFQGNRTHADIDIFFPDTGEYKKAADIAKSRSSELYETENAKRIKYSSGFEGIPMQFDLVKRHFSDPIATIRSFDFTVCAAAVSPVAVYLHNNFLFDLGAKHLVLNKEPTNLAILRRLHKYGQKGFHITNEELIKIAKAIQKLNLDDTSSSLVLKDPYNSLHLPDEVDFNF